MKPGVGECGYQLDKRERKMSFFRRAARWTGKAFGLFLFFSVYLWRDCLRAFYMQVRAVSQEKLEDAEIKSIAQKKYELGL